MLYLFSATTKDGEIELYILYSVPFLKSNCNVYGKTVTVDDFRGVSISPVISKVFEHCVLDRCGAFLVVVTINLDFKRTLAVSALYTRCIRFTISNRLLCGIGQYSEHLCCESAQGL